MMVKYGADLTAINKVSYNRPPLLLAAENGSLFACIMLVDQLKQDINVISIERQGILETIEQNRKFLATRKEKIKPGKADYPLVQMFFWAISFYLHLFIDYYSNLYPLTLTPIDNPYPLAPITLSLPP
jgi:hypothetical protein